MNAPAAPALPNSFPTMLPRKGGSLLVEMVSGTDREFIPLAIPAKR